ncbi:hypothetical protein BC828DRAFT_402812 [Blastocladiella britannica]|nr:hypothetical protein BC828DRAFT_402812 [Blastocladiella britannica]
MSSSKGSRRGGRGRNHRKSTAATATANSNNNSKTNSKTNSKQTSPAASGPPSPLVPPCKPILDDVHVHEDNSSNDVSKSTVPVVALAPPSPPSPPPPKPKTTATRADNGAIVTVPGGITVRLHFSYFGQTYAMDAFLAEGSRVADRVAQLVQRYAVPDHRAPDLEQQATDAVRDANRSHWDRVGSDPSLLPGLLPPPDVISTMDFTARIAGLVGGHHPVAASTAGLLSAREAAENDEAFARAYLTVTESSVSGLFDAVLALQLRYAGALQALAAKRAADLARVAESVPVPLGAPLRLAGKRLLHHAASSSGSISSGSLSSAAPVPPPLPPRVPDAVKADARTAVDMWHAQMLDLAADQRDEFRFFIVAAARVLERMARDGIKPDYAAVMRQVFATERSIAVDPASSKGKRSRRASVVVVSPGADYDVGSDRSRRGSHGSVRISTSPAAASPTIAGPRRTLRKSASTELLRLAHPISSEDDDDDDQLGKGADKLALVTDPTDGPRARSASMSAAETTTTASVPSNVSLNAQSILARRPSLDPLVNQIVEMGFTSEQASAALFLADKDVERALAILLESSDQVDAFIKSQQDEARARRASTSILSSSSSTSAPKPIPATPGSRASTLQHKLSQRLARELPLTTPSGPSSPSTPTAASTPVMGGWSPLRFLQTDAVQGKLSGLFSAIAPAAAAAAAAASASATTPTTSHPGPHGGAAHSSSRTTSPSPRFPDGLLPFPLLSAPTTSPTALESESFPVRLGTQLKVPFIVTLVLVPHQEALAAYLVPPTPPPGSTRETNPAAWGDAVAVRSRMSIDLMRSVHVVCLPYPVAWSPRQVAEEGLVGQVSESMVPELVFGEFKDQVRRAAVDAGMWGPHETGDRAWWENHDLSLASQKEDVGVPASSSSSALSFGEWVQPGLVDAAAKDGDAGSDRDVAVDPLGSVLVTKHSNLASGNAVAHIVPAVPPRAADPATGAPALHPDLHLLRRTIAQLRPRDALDLSVPVAFRPHAFESSSPAAAAPGGSGDGLPRRIEAVVKAVRAAMLERARARVFGAPARQRPGSQAAAGGSAGRSVSALSVPSEADGALEGGTVVLVCVGDDEWRVARRVVLDVFKTG